jgi:hypothetical protein
MLFEMEPNKISTCVATSAFVHIWNLVTNVIGLMIHLSIVFSTRCATTS